MTIPSNLLIYRSNGRFRISAPNPLWPHYFTTIATSLATALSFDSVPFLSIEHIGSTSVPNLRAKAIIDILLVIKAEEFHDEKRLQILEALSGKTGSEGAYHNNNGDGGVKGRWTFKLNGIYPYRSLYVVPFGSIPHRNPITVRDTLRQHPDLRDEYERIKRDLAKTIKAEDLSQYSVRKGPIIRKLLRRGGWSEAEIEEMEAGNQWPGRELEVVSFLGVEDGDGNRESLEGVPIGEDTLGEGMVCGAVVAQVDGLDW